MVGLWLFTCVVWILCGMRFAKLEDRIDKLEGRK